MEANLPPAPPPIRNNALIVEEKEISSSSKKLPSLTNEGMSVVCEVVDCDVCGADV